jgi:serine/threonine protein kinase
VVYKAKQTKLGRVVALKMLLAGAHAGEKELARFRAEATTVAQIQHPNVIQVFDVGEHEGVPYLACEYAGGGDLTKWLGGEPLPLVTAVRLVYNLARAVGAAHQKGVVHRDLKPANILLTADEVPKVADFGLAKQFGEQGPTTTGSILGTPQYMSPEQAAGLNRRVGPPTDVYALGVILYECLTGKQPFAGNSVMDTLDRVRFSQPIPLHELRADIPPELAVIVRRCLEKVPEERYRTADALADDLARIPRASAAVPAGGGFVLPEWLAPVLGIIAVVVLGVVIYQRGGLGESRPTPPTRTDTKPVPVEQGKILVP